MIRVLLVDNAPQTLANIERLLEGEPGIEACSRADTLESALARAAELHPDVVVVDLDFHGIDGIQTVGQLSQAFPTMVIIVTGLDDSALARQAAFDAGAGEYLPKPYAGAELLAAIHRLISPHDPVVGPEPRPASPATAPTRTPPRHPGRQVVAVVAAKGGAGTTMMATNLALVIANETSHAVVLVDFDLVHGHLHRLLRLEGAQGMLDPPGGGDLSVPGMNGILVRGPAGLAVLAAPSFPAEPAADDGFAVGLLTGLREHFEVVIVDVPNRSTAVETALLQAADRVVIVVTMSDLGVRATVGLRRRLADIGVEPGRVQFVLNRSEANSDLSRPAVEQVLEQPVELQLPYDPALVSTSMNRGAAFVLERPDAQVSRRVRDLAATIVPMPDTGTEPVRDRSDGKGRGSRSRKPRRRLFGIARP